MTEETNTRWTPVLKGRAYCSPACGCGCTKDAYDRAVRQSAALCKMLGEGWKPHVWENGGWHYDVVKGPMRLHVWRRQGVVTGYSAEIRTPDQIWPTEEKFLDPLAAIRHTVKVAEGQAASILSAVAEVLA